MDDFLFTLAIITSDNWQIYAVLICALIAGVSIYEKIDAIRHRNTTNPPLHDVYFTKEEAAEMEARFNRSIGGLGGKMDTLSKSFQTHTGAVNRSLGRLEGRVENQT